MKIKRDLFGIYILAFASITLFLGSCDYAVVEVPEVIIPDVYTYAADIEPIFDKAGCTGCHNAESMSANMDLTTGNSWQSIQDNGFVTAGNPDGSAIFTVPSPAGTHFKKFSNTQSALIQKWIEDGALFTE